MTFGSVKYFNLDKGYGLITRDDGSEDIIVQQSEVDRARLGQLAARQRLGFDIETCARGRKAINLWATFGDR